MLDAVWSCVDYGDFHRGMGGKRMLRSASPLWIDGPPMVRPSGGPAPARGRDGANSATGTRTRVARVRAEYPDQLDYSGSWVVVET